jgi:head-tail adaptor
MIAGKLTHLLTAERAITALNQYRTPIETFPAVFTLKAERVKSSREENANTAGNRTITFRIRVADVRLSDRIIVDGLSYDVEGIEEIGRKALDLRLVARAA